MVQKVYGKGFNGWSQLAIFLSLAGGGFIIGGIISLPVWQIMTHGSILNMEKDMLQPANASAAQVIQVISAVFMFAVPTIAFACICYRTPLTFLGFKEKLNPKLLLIVLLIVACSLPFMGLLEELNKAIPLPATTRLRFDAMEKKYNELVMVMVELKTWGQYITSLLIIAVLPAVTEEMLFRGGLQNLLSRWTRLPWLSIIITSLLFSAIHLSWYGFLVRFALGIVLGLIFYYTKNIWLSILAHFINNALVVTSLFVMARQGKPIDMSAGGSFPWMVGAAALLLMVILIRWLIKNSTVAALGEDDESKNDVAVFDPNNPFEKM